MSKESEVKSIVNIWVYGAIVLLFVVCGILLGFTGNKADRAELQRVEKRVDKNCEKIDQDRELIHANTIVLTEVKILLKQLKDKK